MYVKNVHIYLFLEQYMISIFSGYSGFLHQLNWPSRYNWNIVESCAKHHNPNSYFSLLWNCQIFEDFIDNFIVAWMWKKHRYLKEEQQNEEPSAKRSLNNMSINEWKLSDILEKNHPLKLQFMIILGISFIYVLIWSKTINLNPRPSSCLF
jgi:hypothetical protein